MASIKQYSDRTDQELRRIVEVARQDPQFRFGEIPLELPDRGRQIVFVRTETNTATPTYPTFVDAKGFKLPCKLLKVTYNQAASDPVTLSTVIDGLNWYVFSPYCWIPRYIDLFCSWHDGMLIPISVPQLEVTLSASIASGSGGNVSIVKHGSANGQVFKAYFDHMDSGTAGSGVEATVALREAEKKWRIVELACG